MTPDEKASGAVRKPGFDRWDIYTQYAVDAFLAPFTGVDPATGLYTVDRATAPVGETGALVVSPVVWEIMQRVDDPNDLTDREVLTLVLTCDDSGTYSRAEWDPMVAQHSEAAKARQAAAKLIEAKRRKRGSVSATTPPGLHAVPGYRTLPDADLKCPAKDRRRASLKAALERREKRKALGVVLIPDRRAFEAMSKSEKVELRRHQERFALNHTHLREMSDEMLEGPDVDSVGFLYHHGRAPRQTNDGMALTSAWARGEL